MSLSHSKRLRQADHRNRSENAIRNVHRFVCSHRVAAHDVHWTGWMVLVEVIVEKVGDQSRQKREMT